MSCFSPSYCPVRVPVFLLLFFIWPRGITVLPLHFLQLRWEFAEGSQFSLFLSRLGMRLVTLSSDHSSRPWPTSPPVSGMKTPELRGKLTGLRVVVICPCLLCKRFVHNLIHLPSLSISPSLTPSVAPSPTTDFHS